MTAERIQALRRWSRDELARGRERMQQMGMGEREIAALLSHAKAMHAEQIACVERAVGLAPAVVAH